MLLGLEHICRAHRELFADRVDRPTRVIGGGLAAGGKETASRSWRAIIGSAAGSLVHTYMGSRLWPKLAGLWEGR